MKLRTMFLLTIVSLAVSVREDIMKSELKDCTKIGKGAFGAVEKCQDGKTGIWYAVKAQKVNNNPNSMAMKEIQTLIDLADKQVPGIAGLKFIDRSQINHGEKKIYLGFDVFDKGDLGKFIGNFKYMQDRNEAKKLAEKLALHLIIGLTNIQRAGILHLDIKPENVLVDRHDVPHYADFGFSEAYRHDNQKGDVKGTPGFMDENVVCGGLFSKKTDSWALGIMLIEVFKGGQYTSHRSHKYGEHFLSVKKIVAETQKLTLNDLPFYPTHSEVKFLEIIKDLFLNINCDQRKTAGDVVEIIKKHHPGVIGEKKVKYNLYAYLKAEEHHHQGGLGTTQHHHQGGLGTTQHHHQGGFGTTQHHHQGGFGTTQHHHQGGFGTTQHHHQGGFGTTDKSRKFRNSMEGKIPHHEQGLNNNFLTPGYDNHQGHMGQHKKLEPKRKITITGEAPKPKYHNLQGNKHGYNQHHLGLQ